jgi:hypothetical protein
VATTSGTRGQGPGGRRPTKAERREEARLERERIQRRSARRKRNRTIGVVLVALALVATIVAIVVLQPGGSTAAADTPEDLLQEAASAAEAAGCDQVQTVPPDGGISDPNDPGYIDQNHIGSGDFLTGPDLSTYPSIPPTSGPHAPIPPGPIAAGIYDSPPDIYRAIHSLEHGATIVWYRPGISQEELDRLTAFYGQSLDDAAIGQDRVIVAPYDYPDQGDAGQLPDGVNMALAGWHRLRSCGAASLPVAFDFTSRFSAPPWGDRQYEGEAPEAGATL